MKKIIVTIVVLLFTLAGAYCTGDITPIIGVKNGNYVIERVEVKEETGTKVQAFYSVRYITAAGKVYAYYNGEWYETGEETEEKPEAWLSEAETENKGIIKKQKAGHNEKYKYGNIQFRSENIQGPVVIPYGSDISEDVRDGVICLYYGDSQEGKVILLQIDSALINYDSAQINSSRGNATKAEIFSSLVTGNQGNRDALEDLAYVIAESIRQETDFANLFYNPKATYRKKDSYLNLYLEYNYSNGKQPVLSSFFDTDANTETLTGSEVAEAASQYEVPRELKWKELKEGSGDFTKAVLKDVNGLGDIEG